MKRLFLLLLILSLSSAAFATSISPDSLVAIEEEAFAGDVSLENLIISEEVTSIGSRAFAETALKTITIPSSVTDIPGDAFENVRTPMLILTEPGSTAVTYALRSNLDFRADTVCRALVIGQTEYPGDSKLEGPGKDIVKLQAILDGYSVTTATNLTAEGIRNSIASTFSEARDEDISLFYYSGHGSAFDGSLVGIDLASCVTPAELRAALDCVPGRKIVIVDACYSGGLIGKSAESSDPAALFIDAFKLLQYPAGKRSAVFTIPEFVNTIGDYAFYGCRHLTNLYMGEAVNNLGKASFAYCENLAEIVLSSGIGYLPDAVFGGDKNLISIVFSGTAPAGIGDGALYQTSEVLILKYLPGKSGWTDQQWVGPDGQVYSTQCITDNYLVTLEKIDGMTLRVELTCRIPVNRPLAIVVSALENGKTVATKTSIVKSESACYHVSLNGDSVEVFLLDAQTAAPLAAKTSLSGLSASANQDCEIHIQKVETNLKSRGVLALYSDTEHEVCSTETQSVTVTQLKARALDADKPAVISTLRVNKDVLWDWTHPFQNGGVISLTLSTKNVRFRLDASRALAGDYRQANALAYFDAKYNDSITFRDANGNFQRPRFQYDDHFKVGVLSIGLESHELLRETIKVKYNHNVEIISAQYDGTLDTDGALDVSVQGNFVNYGYDLNVVGAQRGETLLNISGNTGLGPGWSSPSIPLGKYGGLTGFTPDRISVGFGTPTNKHGWNQYGMNLNTNIDFNPSEFVKFVKAEYADDFVDWANALYAFVVETVDEASQKVSDQVFIRYTLDAENKVEDAWMMPGFTAKYLQGDALFNQALPKSQGGTVMPADSAKQTGGGKVNTSGKKNQLSQAEIEAIKQATTAAELAGKMPNISYIDQTFPQNIQTQISTSTGSGITGVGLPQDQIQSIIKDLGHGVYQIPFSIW